MFLANVFKSDKKVEKMPSTFVTSVCFYIKRFGYIHLSSILHVDNVKILFPDKSKIDGPPTAVCSFGKAIIN